MYSCNDFELFGLVREKKINLFFKVKESSIIKGCFYPPQDGDYAIKGIWYKIP